MSGRLILHGAMPPAENMAIDEALLLACEEGAAGFPALRFYWWTVPTLSLGAKERVAEAADVEACRRRGVALVRRSTGGRAVLHNIELTYSIVGRLGEKPFTGSVTSSYGVIAAALLSGLKSLGAGLELAAGERRSRGEHMPCFAAPSRFELAAGGRKVVGSAQRRMRNAVLQHGSILIRPEAELLAAATGHQQDTAILARSMAGLEELLGREVSRAEIIDALVPQLSPLLGELARGGISERERQTSLDLLKAERFEVTTGHETAPTR